MIITRLIGGLGNQMFQYACGLALATHHRVPLKLDIRGFDGRQKRRFTLDQFNISASVGTADDLPSLPQIYSPLVRLLGRWYRPRGLLIYREYQPTYNRKILTVGNNLYLDGYWQSEKYFSAVAEELRKQFQLRQPLDTVNQKLSVDIKSSHSVSLHIRRGDYVGHSLYANCTPEYYRRGLGHISERYPDLRLYVFSDDPAWVRKNLITKFPTTYIDHNLGSNDYKDLVLMSRCRHHIIANSSFSWWGAWLGTDADGIVIAPNAWYTDPSKDITDLLPDRWMKIPL